MIWYFLNTIYLNCVADGWIYHVDAPNFDYVILKQYILEVQASDTLHSLNSDAKNLTVYLIWIDTAPKFTPNTYSIEITEGLVGENHH